MRSLTLRSGGWRPPSSLIALTAWAVSLAVPGAQQEPLAHVTARASAYVAEFERTFATLVAEERYDQSFTNPAVDLADPDRNKKALSNLSRSRRLRSSFMLVLVPGRGFTPFRDVFEVDGKPVHDRDDRLRSLFVKPSASSLEQAQRITDESARYNVSDVERTINVPLFALLFLHPTNVSHFSFSKGGEETVSGRRLWAVDFRETVLPTIVRGEDGKNVLSRGRFWIEPESGAVYQTRHELSERGQATITVRYAEQQALSILVPARMEEVYRGLRDSMVLRGTATYENYERVGVSTEVQIAKPPVKPPG
ncbi:MAG: hypothetical protein ABI665_01560 [Vicinamibacterales bacterium]